MVDCIRLYVCNVTQGILVFLQDVCVRLEIRR